MSGTASDTWSGVDLVCPLFADTAEWLLMAAKRTFTESKRPKNANKRYCSVAERTRSPQTARPGANSHALIGEHKVYASVAESLDEKVEKRTHLGHAMPTLRASSSSSAEGALNTVYEIEGALENDGLVIRGLHEAVLPPLTPSIWPVTNEALSDAR